MIDRGKGEKNEEGGKEKYIREEVKKEEAGRNLVDRDKEVNDEEE